jgi:hypothetical protein
VFSQKRWWLEYNEGTNYITLPDGEEDPLNRRRSKQPKKIRESVGSEKDFEMLVATEKKLRGFNWF